MVQIRAILLESNRHPHCDTHPQTDCQNVYRPTWIGRSRSLLCALLCIIYCLDIATTTTFLWFPEPMPWSVSSRPVLCTVCIRVVHSGLYSLSSMDRSISISSPHCGWHPSPEVPLRPYSKSIHPISDARDPSQNRYCILKRGIKSGRTKKKNLFSHNDGND